MLFNSYLFIFCFLPIVWAGFHILKALSIRQAEQEYIESKQMTKQTEFNCLDSKSLESQGQDSQTLKHKEANLQRLKLKNLKSKSLESQGLKFKTLDSSTQVSKRLTSTQYMNLAKIFLVLSSLFFYAYWKLIYLPILLGSIVVNYFLAQGILKSLYAKKQIDMNFNGGGG